MMTPLPALTLRAQLWALLRQRCPRCGRAKMFHGTFAMHQRCPACGLLFQREEGYFLGAMYSSYILAAGLLGLFFLAAHLLLPDTGTIVLAVVALVPFVPLIPAVWRWSRVLWIYFERWANPSDAAAGAWEKAKARQGRDWTDC